MRPQAKDVFAAIKAKDAEKLESILGADATLASARSEKGHSAVLVAMFAMKSSEAFERPQDNRLLKALLARGPALDRFEVAALGDPALVARAIDRDAEYVRAVHAIGWTPLHFAAFGGNARAADILLSRGAAVDVRAKNKLENTPLQVALLTEQAEVARLLVARGADVNATMAEGFTALHEAAQLGNTAIAALLLDHGANVDAPSPKGTPLALALAGKHDALAALLRARGATSP